MTKLRKQRRKKQYKTNINRKRQNKNRNKLGKIPCKPVENAWDNHKTIKSNLQQMGLMFDPNATIKKLNNPNEGETYTVSLENDETKTLPSIRKRKARKNYVAEELEKDAKAPRERMFRLPKGQVEYITYLLDKYGNDYKAMTQDRRNYNQETWKQLRSKIKVFMSIPEQSGPYLLQNPTFSFK